MSAPFIVWTMQRTGGTTLAALLEDLSEFPSFQHEPFNVDRVLGWIVKHWQENGSPTATRENILHALETKPVIKHCYELIPDEFNLALMASATKLGYRHIILDRRDEPKRILSLELAKLTGAWGGNGVREIYDSIQSGKVKLDAIDQRSAMHQMARSYNSRRTLSEQMTQSNVSPFVVYFEDVYSDPEAGRKRISELLNFVGIKPENFDNYAKQVDDALLTRGQNSASIMGLVPNIRNVQEALEDGHKKQSFQF